MFPLARFLALYLKFFFLLTPFFVLGVFLSLTEEAEDALRNKLAVKISLGAAVTTLLIFLLGAQLMLLFDITVDAFRIGAGILLLLTAISLMNPKVVATKEGEDISVVPLAMPVIVGPASCGAIMVTSAELHTIGAKLMGFAALAVALIFIWVILLLGTWFERQLGKRGISILMRLTALILAALSAQMVMTGVCGFLKG